MHRFSSKERRYHRFRRPTARIEGLETRRLLATYYLSPAGNDANPGTSPQAAWRTLDRASTFDFAPGDSLLLEGGQTFTASSGGSSNLLSNGGFESGLASWNVDLDSSPGNTTISTELVHSGTYSLRISDLAAGGRGQDVTSSVLPNVAYTFRVRGLATSVDGRSRFGMRFFNNGQLISDNSSIMGQNNWREYLIPIVAPPQFDKAEVYVRKELGTSVLYIDDAVLQRRAAALSLGADDTASRNSPLTIGSYGSGRATIDARDGSGILATNMAGLVVRDLRLTGTWNASTGSGPNLGYGVDVLNTLPNNQKLDYIRVDSVEATGFKFGGIHIDTANQKAGYTDVRITNCRADRNGDVGIAVRGEFDRLATGYSNANIYIGNCFTDSNSGIPGLGGHSGSGIIIADTNGGMIERCVASNNGTFSNLPQGGPVGIWAWDSNAIIIQYNESFGNRSAGSTPDGGGFDIDGGSTNCIMQYNYSHDNQGAGFLMWQFQNARPMMNNNIIRYNVSENDGRKNHYAGIYVGGGEAFSNNHVYNNTIYYPKGQLPNSAAIRVSFVGQGNTFRNNNIITTGDGILIQCDGTTTPQQALFQNNNYWTSGGTFLIKWHGNWCYNLEQFRAIGQEKIGSANTGLSVDPKVVAPGGGGTINNPSLLAGLSAYRLQNSSPLINAGFDLSSAGMNSGGKDFAGNAVPAQGATDIGAFEFASAPPPAPPATPTGTDAADTFVLRRVGTQVQMFVNSPTAGTPSFTWNFADMPALTIDGKGGDDTFVIDLIGGGPLPLAGITFNADAGNDSVIIEGTSRNESVFASDLFVQLGGRRLNHTAVENVVFRGGRGDDTMDFDGTFNRSIRFVGGSGVNRLNVLGGLHRMSRNPALDSQNLILDLRPGSTLDLNGAGLNRLAWLGIGAGATLNLAGGANKVLFTQALSMGSSATLELNDNDLIVDYSDRSRLATIASLIGSARGGGNWTGFGITSSAARNARPKNLGLGVIEAAQFISTNGSSLFSGVPIDNTAILVKSTYVGDANLDGTVDSRDVARLNAGLRGGRSGWFNGDFDLDGDVDASDKAMQDLAILSQDGAR
jgi:hypothetical protein